MRAAAVTVTLVALAALMYVMGARWTPSLGSGECPCARASANVAKKPVADLTNRIWRHQTPKDARDLTLHLALFDRARIRTGAVGHLSQWRYLVDRIRFKIQGDTLTLESPQTQTKTKFKVRTWRCKGEAPAPFDMCLELKKGGRSLRLYSERNHGFGAKGLAPLTDLATAGGDVPPCDDCQDGLPEWFDRLAD